MVGLPGKLKVPSAPTPGPGWSSRNRASLFGAFELAVPIVRAGKQAMDNTDDADASGPGFHAPLVGDWRGAGNPSIRLRRPLFLRRFPQRHPSGESVPGSTDDCPWSRKLTTFLTARGPSPCAHYNPAIISIGEADIEETGSCTIEQRLPFPRFAAVAGAKEVGELGDVADCPPPVARAQACGLRRDLRRALRLACGAGTEVGERTAARDSAQMANGNAVTIVPGQAEFDARTCCATNRRTSSAPAYV